MPISFTAPNKSNIIFDDIISIHRLLSILSTMNYSDAADIPEKAVRITDNNTIERMDSLGAWKPIGDLNHSITGKAASIDNIDGIVDDAIAKIKESGQANILLVVTEGGVQKAILIAEGDAQIARIKSEANTGVSSVTDQVTLKIKEISDEGEVQMERLDLLSTQKVTDVVSAGNSKILEIQSTGGSLLQEMKITQVEVKADADRTDKAYEDAKNYVDVEVDKIVAAGLKGSQGIPGAGIIPAGLKGQVLAKKSSVDFDTTWEDITISFTEL